MRNRKGIYEQDSNRSPVLLRENIELSNTKTGRMKVGTRSLTGVPAGSLEWCQTHSPDKWFKIMGYRLGCTLEVKWKQHSMEEQWTMYKELIRLFLIFAPR